MTKDLRTAVKGALAGGAATAAMSALMLASRKAGLSGTLPPTKITEEALKSAGVDDLSAPARDVASGVLHFAFGMGSGALFGVLSERARPSIAPVAQGLGFGALVWAVSYLGWVPALGILPPAPRDRPDRALTMVLAHGVYGALLGAMAGRA